MTRTWMGVVALFFAVSAQAAQLNIKSVSFDASAVKLSQAAASRFGTFSEIKVEGLQTTKTVGAPELPVKSYLLIGKPADITVTVEAKQNVLLANTRPSPVQPQQCRCDNVPKKAFAFDSSTYEAIQAPYTLTYVGAFRGTPITRLDVPLALYHADTNGVTLHSEMQITTNAPDYSFRGGDYNDYLIIVPDALAAGVDEFVAYKKSKGFNVSVEKVLSPANTLATLQSTIKQYYQNGVDFVILVGDDKAIPMSFVDTSGSAQTPTDLPNFTMDGPDDHIPDMFYSRIVAASADQVRAQLAKSMDYEQRTASSLGKIVGVASNEGYQPSDKDYITSINNEFKKGAGVSELFLYQNNPDSNTATLNKQLNEGAFWMTYVGHGSGFSWPSFGVAYQSTDFAKLSNKDSTKPVIIDVACMNGRVSPDYLGASAMNVNGAAAGAAAYLGGTVNISWHPPALMARGIAIEHNAKHFNYLGEAILAGQMYLTANWTNQEEVVDNFEWYHLQGDPGMKIKF